MGGEEGSAGAGLREQGQGEGAPNCGNLQDGELCGAASSGMGNKTSVRYPKTKKVSSSYTVNPTQGNCHVFLAISHEENCSVVHLIQFIHSVCSPNACFV